MDRNSVWEHLRYSETKLFRSLECDTLEISGERLWRGDNKCGFYISDVKYYVYNALLSIWTRWNKFSEVVVSFHIYFFLQSSVLCIGVLSNDVLIEIRICICIPLRLNGA